MQRGFTMSLVLIVILIVLVTGGGIYWTQKINNKPPTGQSAFHQTSPDQNYDETIKWKTYTNKTFSYEFKYPNNWFLSNLENVVDNEGRIQNSIAINPQDNLQRAWDEIRINSVQIKTVGDRTRFNESINNLKSAQDFKLGNVFAKRGEIVEQTVKEMTLYPTPKEEVFNVVLLEHNNNLFMLTSTQYDLDIFNKILSTFKFN